ncbi:MAG: hypothetical protein PF961_11925 [Planctomycetota bacterium]|nr:hypothetical protein [Planctomycetota bacterium]
MRQIKTGKFEDGAVFSDKLDNDVSYVNRDYIATPRMIISKRMRDIFEQVGGLVDLAYDRVYFDFLDFEHEYYAVGFIPRLGCVDTDRSDAWIDEDDGSILEADKLVFDAEALEEADYPALFDLKGRIGTFCFRDDLAAALNAAALEGFKLYPLAEWHDSLPAKDPDLTIEEELTPQPPT